MTKITNGSSVSAKGHGAQQLYVTGFVAIQHDGNVTLMMLAATTRSRALLFIINPWNVTDSSEMLPSPHLCPPRTLQIHQGLRSLYDSDPGLKSHIGLERITHLSLFRVHFHTYIYEEPHTTQCPSEEKGQQKPMLQCKVPRD